MCSTNDEFTGNKVLVCQVGDLEPGDRYRTPEGATMLILGMPNDHTIGSVLDGLTAVTMIEPYANGCVTVVNNSVKLGTDRAGRLYASRSLNQTPKTEDDADDVCILTDDPMVELEEEGRQEREMYNGE